MQQLNYKYFKSIKNIWLKGTTRAVRPFLDLPFKAKQIMGRHTFHLLPSGESFFSAEGFLCVNFLFS